MEINLSPEFVGVICVTVMLVLMFFRMWIGLAMGIVGFIGFAYLTSFDSAMSVLGLEPFRRLGDYNMATVPMFILMGTIICNTGISEDLFRSANAWVGELKGGLAIATIFACTLFAAICGSSLAGTVTMGKMAIPEMKKYRYSESFASAVVAIGGTLGSLIPPSIGFILYALLTELSVGKLFMAGILPGVLLAFIIILVVITTTIVNPDTAPAGPKTSFGEKITSLRFTWSMILIFLFVMGGIYFGVFTPTEAGALGSFGAFVVGVIGRRMNFQIFVDTVVESVKTTGMLTGIVLGAFIFMRLMTISGLPNAIADFVCNVEVNRYVILLNIVTMYIILGLFTDIIASILITIPVIYPIVLGLGFDPIWFGVVVVIVMEMGMITPPVGMNIFVLSGTTGIPLKTIFSGIWPFLFAQVFCIIVITIFPQIALYIPNSM